MEWLRKNGALSLGIGMPLLLAVFFALASWLPGLFVEPPRYDVVFLTGYAEYGTEGLRLEVKNGRARFYVRGHLGYMDSRLYRYSPAEHRLTEIPLSIPSPVRGPSDSAHPDDTITGIPVPELASLRLDPSTIAPDGYVFDDALRHGPGLFGAFFYSSRHAQPGRLSKNGHVVRLPSPGGNSYISNVKLVGWVIP